MAVGDLITDDYQLEVNETLLLGAGTVYDIISMEGFDLPSIRSGDTAKTLRNGYWAGSDLLDGRTITLELTVSSPDDDTQAAALDALTTAFNPTSGEQTFAFQLPGYTKRFVNARVRRINVPVSWEYQFHLPTVTVELYATDPLIYDCVNSGETVTVQVVAGGGFVFDVTPPFVFGAMPTGGRVVLTNSGTYKTTPYITVYGDGLVNFYIFKSGSNFPGEYIGYTGTLADGQNVQFDFTNHSVLINGTSWYSALTVGSTWFDIDVGTTELIFVNGDNGAGPNAKMSVEYRSAWI